MVIKRSPRLVFVLLSSHIPALVAVCLTDIPLPYRFLLCLLVLSSLAYYLARDALLRLPHSWRELGLEHGRVSVVERDGSRTEGELAGNTVVTPYFVWLGYTPQGRRFPVFRMLCADALTQEEFRQMRVVLRMG